MNYPEVLCILLCLFFAVTFLESGLDKVIHRAGNLSWIQGHFEKTFLNRFSTLLFYSILIQELAVGAIMVFSVAALVTHQFELPKYGFIWACFLLIQLFSGQRIAKDYVGAAGIVPYIILAAISIYFFQ